MRGDEDVCGVWTSEAWYEALGFAHACATDPALAGLLIAGCMVVYFLSHMDSIILAHVVA